MVVSCPGSQVSCAPLVSLSANRGAGVPSAMSNTGAALTSVAQQILSGNPSTSVLPSVSDIAEIAAAIRSPAALRRSVTESALALAVRAAVAAGRGPNVLGPITVSYTHLTLPTIYSV